MMADPLPFSSLRLLIPPLRLLTEAMWDVARQQNIKYYGMLEDFVCMVTEAVPQLLTDTQRGLLLAALRAKTMLFDPEDIHTQLDRIHPVSQATQENEPDQWQLALLTLTDKVMQSSTVRQRLLQEVFNQTFDSALQSLLSDFLSRIEQMFPVPNFKQAASWLSAAPSGVEACLQEVEIENLRELLTDQGYSLGQATTTVCCDSEKILLSTWSHPLITKPTSEVSPPTDGGEQSEAATDVVGPVSLDKELVVNVDKKEDMEETVTGQTSPSVEDKMSNKISDESEEESSLTPVLQQIDGVKEAPGNSAVQSDCTADPLPFSSLRLLIPPLRLLTAAMWDVARQQNLKYYGMLEDFVCMVTEAVPQLLTDTQSGLLLAALRAKTVLSDPEDIHTHLDRIHFISKATQENEPDQWQLALLTLTDKVMQSSTVRQRLLQEVFNQTFDSALQSLLSDFLSRIEQMFPVPNFKQAASWLSAASSGVKACLQEVDLEDLRELLANQGYSLGQATTTVGCDSEKILISAWSHPLISKLASEVPPPADSAEQSDAATDVVGPVSLEEEQVKMEVVVTIEDEQEELEETVTGQTSPSVEEQVSNESSEESDEETWDGVMEAPGNSVVQSEDSVNTLERSCSEFTANAMHSISHNSQRVAHKCPQCGKCFIYRSQVIRHLRTNKSCSVALTTVGDVNLQDPTGGGDDEPHSHETCAPEQSSSQTLSCFQCCATFRTKAELLLHQRSHRARPVYQCGQCDKKFHHLSSLTNHKQTHMHLGGFTCSRCHKAFPSAKERDAHGLQHRSSSLTCTVCKKKFSSQMMLLRHLQSHSVEGASPQYSCRFCENSFSGVTELRIHQRSHTCRSYQCDQCSKSYGSLAVLQSHQASHSAERRFLCPHCGKRVKTRDGLESHMRTHTGERPYHCPYCPKDFTALAGLNVHVRQHTGERPYVCTVCGKGWPSGGDLQKHMRTHTGERPYICQDCGKGFSNSCHLTEHRRIHTGEKPFSCPECGKCLRRKFDLKKHILSHSSVRPYACIFCDKSYTRKTHLNRHLRTHSTEAAHMEAQPTDHSSNTPPAVCD